MRTSVRWIVPVALAATVAGGVAVSSARADSVPDVPARTAEQVLASVATAGTSVTALSGTVVTRADLGLPALDLTGMGGGGDLSPTDLQGLATRFLSGENTLRVWLDGETKQRVQLVDKLDEFDVVRNGTQVWTYSARQNEVGKATLSPGVGEKHRGLTGSATPKPSDLTPEAMAKQAIAAADPTTAVTLGEPETVAGRAAYALTLTPRTKETLVDRIVIAVDAEKGVPLQVEVFARGHGKAAIQTGFTSIDYTKPSADIFTFTPPAGAKVSDLGDHGHATAVEPSASATPAPLPSTSPSSSAPAAAPSSASAEPIVTGKGWATVVEFPAGTAGPLAGITGSGPAASGPAGSGSPSADPAEAKALGNATALLNQLTKPVSGGRAMTSRLLTVLITDDGRVLAGSVPVQTLIDAARK